MRLVLDRRARRLLARVPRADWYSVAEIGLLLLLAGQIARVLLALVTPVGPIGDWRPDVAAPAASPAILATFDPFFRLAPGGAVVVTGLNIRLFGIRADQASGRGSAILGLAGGIQSSVSVGEAVMPGVILKAVAFDHVTILRGQAEEQLFLDQSTPATVIAPAAAPFTGASPAPGGMPAQAAIAIAPPQVTAAALLADARLAPRIGRNGVDGFTVQGGGEALRAAGLQTGDVVVSVNGQRVSGAEDAARVQGQLGRGGVAGLIVERGGGELPVRVTVTP